MLRMKKCYVPLRRLLKELRTKTDLKFLVAYVEQNGVSSLPSGNTIISAGNTLGVLVSKSDFHKLSELCGFVQKEIKKIVLIGAGRIGTIVSEKILSNRKSKKFRTIWGKIKEKQYKYFYVEEMTKRKSTTITVSFNGGIGDVYVRIPKEPAEEKLQKQTRSQATCPLFL